MFTTSDFFSIAPHFKVLVLLEQDLRNFFLLKTIALTTIILNWINLQLLSHHFKLAIQ